MDERQVFAALIGVVVAAAFAWVRATLMGRRDQSHRELDRARWEGSFSATVDKIEVRLDRIAEVVDRIDAKVAQLPCSRCSPQRPLHVAVVEDHQ